MSLLKLPATPSVDGISEALNGPKMKHRFASISIFVAAYDCYIPPIHHSEHGMLYSLLSDAQEFSYPLVLIDGSGCLPSITAEFNRGMKEYSL